MASFNCINQPAMFESDIDAPEHYTSWCITTICLTFPSNHDLVNSANYKLQIFVTWTLSHCTTWLFDHILTLSMADCMNKKGCGVQHSTQKRECQHGQTMLGQSMVMISEGPIFTLSLTFFILYKYPSENMISYMNLSFYHMCVEARYKWYKCLKVMWMSHNVIKWLRIDWWFVLFGVRPMAPIYSSTLWGCIIVTKHIILH